MYVSIQIPKGKKSLVAAKDESGEYIIFESPHGCFSVGDTISGKLDSVGTTIIKNDSTEELVHVQIKEVKASLERVQQLLEEDK
jgi:hypothetical protein